MLGTGSANRTTSANLWFQYSVRGSLFCWFRSSEAEPHPFRNFLPFLLAHNFFRQNYGSSSVESQHKRHFKWDQIARTLTRKKIDQNYRRDEIILNGFSISHIAYLTNRIFSKPAWCEGGFSICPRLHSLYFLNHYEAKMFSVNVPDCIPYPTMYFLNQHDVRKVLVCPRLHTLQIIHFLHQHDARKVLVYGPDCIPYKPYIFWTTTTRKSFQ